MTLPLNAAHHTDAVRGTHAFLEHHPGDTTVHGVHADALMDAGADEEAAVHYLLHDPHQAATNALRLTAAPGRHATTLGRYIHAETEATPHLLGTPGAGAATQAVQMGTAAENPATRPHIRRTLYESAASAHGRAAAAYPPGSRLALLHTAAQTIHAEAASRLPRTAV